MNQVLIADYKEFLEYYDQTMLLFIGNFSEWKNGNIDNETMSRYIAIAEHWNITYKNYGHAEDNPAKYKHNQQMVKRAKESLRNV